MSLAKGGAPELVSHPRSAAECRMASHTSVCAEVRRPRFGKISRSYASAASNTAHRAGCCSRKKLVLNASESFQAWSSASTGVVTEFHRCPLSPLPVVKAKLPPQ